MPSKRELDDSGFIQNVKRKKIFLDNISSQDNEGNGLGSNRSPFDKGEFGSNELYTNSLSRKGYSCNEDRTSKHMHVIDEAKDVENRGKDSSKSEDDSNKRVKGRDDSFFSSHIPEEILTKVFCKLPLHTLFQMQIVCTS